MTVHANPGAGIGSTRKQATILVVDDEASVVLGIQLALSRSSFQILTATSTASALALMRQGPVDVVVSDECMPGMHGTEFLALVRSEFPATARIMLTGKATVEVAARAINEGEIDFFLQKPCPPERLIEAISGALTRRSSRPPAANAHTRDAIARCFPRRDFESLSAREVEVLCLIVDGQRLGEIARSLFVSEHTVRNHLKAIFRKLDVHSQSELMRRGRGQAEK